jgi:hypothetical protein
MPTGTSIHWLWFPIRVTIIFSFLLLKRLDWFAFIYKRIATVIVAN